MADGSFQGGYGFGPIGPRASTTRPPAQADAYGQQTWFRDASGPGKADGTVIPADWLNKIIGTYIGLARESETLLGGNQNNDDFLANAVRGLIRKTRFTVTQIEDLEDRLAQFAIADASHVTKASFNEEVATRESADTYLSARIAALEAAAGSVNANTLNGQPGSYYLNAANLTGTLSPARIAGGALANSKLAQVSSGIIKGRVSAGAGDVEDLTASQVKTLLAIAAGDVTGLGSLATASSVTASQISDASANGRSFLQAASYAAMTLLLSPFGGSGASHAIGLVPDPGASAGSTRFLREDGSWAAPAGGGGSPGGTDGQVQYKSGSSFAAFAGVSITAAGDLLSLIAQAATDIPLVVKAHASQSASLSEWRDSANTAKLYVKKIAGSGNFVGDFRLAWPDRDVALGWGSGEGSLVLTNLAASALANLTLSTLTARSSVSANSYINTGGVELGGAAWRGADQTITLINSAGIGWSSTSSFSGAADAFVRKRSAANIAFGASDAASPVAQILSVQNVVAGVTNTSGANWRRDGSVGTGTGEGGSHDWYVAPAGSSGSAQNALVRALRLRGNRSVIIGDGSAALATNATAGFLYVPSCAGTPTGVPVSETGVIPLVYDSTNGILYFYKGGAWVAVAGGGAPNASQIVPYLGFGAGVA